MNDLPKKTSYYTMSQALIGLFNDIFTKEEKTTVQSLLNMYIEQYNKLKTSHPYLVADMFHNMIDDQLNKDLQKDSLAQYKVSCKKGCHWCCHQSVLITNAEAELIFYYMALTSIEINYDHLALQAKTNKNKWEQLPDEVSKCVFLGPEGQCQIYEVRPSSCRKHLSLDEPELCKTKNPSRKMFISPTAEILASAALSSCPSGNISQMLETIVEKENIEC